MERGRGNSIMAEDLEAYGKKINKFHLENEMSEQYYNLTNGNAEQSFVGITPYYPVLTEKDYKKGEFTRYFVVRYNGDVIEVSRREASIKKSKLPKGLYYYTFIKWRVVDSPVLPIEIANQESSIINVNRFYISQGSHMLPLNIHSPFKTFFSDLEQFRLST